MTSKRLTEKEELSHIVVRTKKYFDVNQEAMSMLKDSQFDGMTSDDVGQCDAIRDIFKRATNDQMDWALVYNEYIISLRDEILGQSHTYVDHEPYAPSKMNTKRDWTKGEVSFLIMMKRHTDRTGIMKGDKEITEKFNRYFGDKLGVRSRNSVWSVYKKILDGDIK